MIETPALDYLVTDGPWRPSGCADCPFATVNLRYDPPNPGDRDEGEYDCALLSLTAVWGEGPKCTEKDWQQRAQVELAALREVRGDPPRP